MIMFLQELREKTYSYHQEIERNALLSKLTGSLNLNDYKAVLKKFYGFYLPLETQLIPPFLKANPDFKKFYFPKIDLLVKDLTAFSITKSQLPIYSSFTQPSNPYGWLGVLYTMEGSCLGRAMLWPRLQKKLALTCDQSFFSSASGDLKGRWATFIQQMTEQVKSDRDKQEVIEGAIWTFKSLNEWFNTKTLEEK
jgi:heme oxygenase